MADNWQSWRNNFRRINGLTHNDPHAETLSNPPRTARADGRKGAGGRLAAIVDADQLALIVTNRRARAGLKPRRFSRFEN